MVPAPPSRPDGRGIRRWRDRRVRFLSAASLASPGRRHIEAPRTHDGRRGAPRRARRRSPFRRRHPGSRARDGIHPRPGSVLSNGALAAVRSGSARGDLRRFRSFDGSARAPDGPRLRGAHGARENGSRRPRSPRSVRGRRELLSRRSRGSLAAGAPSPRSRSGPVGGRRQPHHREIDVVHPFLQRPGRDASRESRRRHRLGGCLSSHGSRGPRGRARSAPHFLSRRSGRPDGRSR